MIARDTTIDPALAAGEADHADGPWPSAVTGWLVVSALCVAYCVSFIDRYLLTLLVEPVKQDLGLSDTEVGLLQGAAFGLFYAAAGIPMGLIADRGSRRVTIAVGMFVWTAMTTMSAFASNFWHLFVARMGVGLGEAALSPAAVSLISDYFPPERRGRAISVFMTGATIGSGLAIMIGGAVVGLTRGSDVVVLPLVGELRPWQAAFFLVGAPGMLMSVLFMVVREPPRRGRSVPSQTGGTASFRRFVADRKALLGLHFTGMACSSICAYGFTGWTPAYFMRVHGWTPEEVGAGLGPAILVGLTAGMLAGGALADRGRGRGDVVAAIRVAAWSLALLAIAAPLATLPSDPVVVLLALGVVNFAVAAPAGVSLTALTALAPNELRGRLVAAYLFTISVAGFGIGPTFVGYLNDHVFTDPGGVRHSLSALGVVFGPLAALSLALAVRPYLTALRHPPVVNRTM